MSGLNAAGVSFVHDRTRPLAVNSMDEAAKVIAAEIANGPPAAVSAESWARHLAWIIGFDALIADRTAIHAVTKFVVEDGK